MSCHAPTHPPSDLKFFFLPNLGCCTIDYLVNQEHSQNGAKKYNKISELFFSFESWRFFFQKNWEYILWQNILYCIFNFLIILAKFGKSLLGVHRVKEKEDKTGKKKKKMVMMTDRSKRQRKERKKEEPTGRKRVHALRCIEERRNRSLVWLRMRARPSPADRSVVFANR